jgi:hypothetical protein
MATDRLGLVGICRSQIAGISQIWTRREVHVQGSGRMVALEILSGRVEYRHGSTPCLIYCSPYLFASGGQLPREIPKSIILLFPDVLASS